MFHINPEVSEAESKGELGYDDKHDAYYNKRTGKWLEEACKDARCGYCNERPETHAIEAYDKSRKNKTANNPTSQAD